MTLVYGKTIFANGLAVTALFLNSFMLVVTRLAQRLELTESEQGPIAVMRLDVVDHSCGLDQGTLEAHGTQRLAQ
jgi:hypothetical protein